MLPSKELELVEGDDASTRKGLASSKIRASHAAVLVSFASGDGTSTAIEPGWLTASYSYYLHFFAFLGYD